MQSFLEEFYHDDHGEQNTRVAFLHHLEPNEDMANILRDPRNEERVQYVVGCCDHDSPALGGQINTPLLCNFCDPLRYIRGSPLRAKDLEKTRLFDAEAVFVLTNQFSSTAIESDAAAVLMVKAIKSTCPWVTVFCQLIRPNSTVRGTASTTGG